MNEPQRIKEAAQRLKADDVLQMAFDRAIQQGYEDLAYADPTDSQAITAIQSRIHAIAEIRKSLDIMIIQVQTERNSGLAPVLVRRT